MFLATQVDVNTALLAALFPIIVFLSSEQNTSMIVYGLFSKHIPLAPPNWLFGVAWSILWPLNAVVLFCLVNNFDDSRALPTMALFLEFVFLLFWPMVFFRMILYTLALFMNIGAFSTALTVAIWAFINGFVFVGVAQTVLCLWLAFALYLNGSSLKYQSRVRNIIKLYRAGMANSVYESVQEASLKNFKS